MKELTPILSGSSSSSFSREWKYDVFLSFRGEDTRSGFTGHLYNALSEKGIRTFIDDSLQRGQQISPALLKAIEESRIAIVIFSANYASSTFCLEELVKILERIKQKRGLVWPVFYKVDPSDVRHLQGSYEKALDKHKDDIRLQKWKLALYEAANLSGWHFEERYKYEYEFIKGIVTMVSKRIDYIQLDVAKHPIGLKSRVDDLISLLDLESNNKVEMVGIHGIAGIGKTTIASAMYNVIVDQFEGLCFFSDVRERSNQLGLLELQKTLLSKLTGEKGIKMGYFREGIQLIKSRLCRKKVLLILDDVNSLKQLEALAGETSWFGLGSRIIIITRDKHLLNVHGVNKNYEVKELCFREALELFSWNAFKKNEVDPRYASISNCLANYCKGLPLALEVIGSNLFGKTQDEWKSALDEYKKILDKNIQNALKVSYDDMGEIEKEIFLDITCFFKGYLLSDVEKILLHGRGYDPKYSIGVLEKKSLLKIEDKHVNIHDLIMQMGRGIVRSQSPSNPENWSRLWSYDDILSILEEDKGTSKIQALVLNMPLDKEVLWNGKGFRKMKNLKILIIKNACFSHDPKFLPNSLRVLEWTNYSSSTLPSDFHPRKLAILNLGGSSLEVLKPLKNFGSLTELVLRGCQFLKEVPDVSGAVNLRKLNVSDCGNLIKVHDSVGLLDKLVRLSARSCRNLRILPRSISEPDHERRLFYWSTVLDGELHLRRRNGRMRLSCHTSMLPILENSKDVFQNSSGDNPERENAANPAAPVSLYIHNGPIVNNLANRYISNWRPYYNKLTNLELTNCNLRDEFLYQLPHWFPCLSYLDVAENNFTILPECMNGCLNLEILILDSCRDLREIKGIPPNIKRVSALDCMSLTSPSSSKLLSQAFHEDRGRRVTVPGYRIPKWIDHRCKRTSISFRCRNEFPRLVLCYIGNLRTINLRIFINGIQVSSDPGWWSPSCTPVIILLDVLEWLWDRTKIVLKENEWNHVSISLDLIHERFLFMRWVFMHTRKHVRTMFDS